MEKIKRLLEEHYEEFTEMINDLYDEKYPSKKDKIFCIFKVAGKHYTSHVFAKNYKSFLSDLTDSIGGKVFKSVLGNFVKFNPSEFSNSIIKKSQYENINDVFYVSTYSSTKIKIKHITDLCEFLDIPLQLEYPKISHIDIARQIRELP
jgi:hypothetical protein